MLVEKHVKTEFRSCTSITAEVDELITKSGIQEGFCVIAVPHGTAALAITSFWDPRGLADLMDEIDRNIPTRVNYKCQNSPYDASGHAKTALMGNSIMLIIYDGKPVLGSSQGIVLVDFDGPRERSFEVQLVEKPLYLGKAKIKTTYMGMHDVTDSVQQIVSQSGVKNGICHVSMLHSTAGILLAPKDAAKADGVMDDIERMVPTRVDFKHRETASDAGGHVKTALTGSQITLAVKDGEAILGAEQAVVFAEYDGPRPRSFTVAVWSD